MLYSLAMDMIAVIAMNVGLAAQNVAEWRGGGPSLPPRIAQRIGIFAPSPGVQRTALILVSALVAALSTLGLVLSAGWLIALVAFALIANALVQVTASVRAGRSIPGTVTGLLVMLPTSVWALLATENPLGWAAGILGPMLSFPVWLMIWMTAQKLSGSRG